MKGNKLYFCKEYSLQMKAKLILSIVLIALFTLLFSNGKINAIGVETTQRVSLSIPNYNHSVSENYSYLLKAKKVSSFKIPVSRRKYFRDERTVTLFDFSYTYNKLIFISEDVTHYNSEYFQQPSFFLSLLRGPPLT